MKKPKKSKPAHTSKAKIVMGDYYGSGIKNKQGISKDVFDINDVPRSNLKKPPKSLA